MTRTGIEAVDHSMLTFSDQSQRKLLSQVMSLHDKQHTKQSHAVSFTPHFTPLAQDAHGRKVLLRSASQVLHDHDINFKFSSEAVTVTQHWDLLPNIEEKVQAE